MAPAASSATWCRRACVGLVLALAVPAGRGEADYVPGGPLQEAGLIKHWQLRLPLVPQQTLADFYLVDDQLYAVTDDGWVYAIHADTGAIRWLRQVTDGGYRIRRPFHIHDRVAFAIPTTLLQLDRLYGDGKSKVDLRFPAGTGPATDGTRLFLGGLDQRQYAIAARNPLAGWKVITDAPITATPVVWDQNVFFASSAGTVYACRAADKALRWQSSIYGSITGDLAVNEHGVYVPGRDQSLYLLDLVFGQVAWQARFSGPLYEPPVVTPELAFQYCPDDGLAAVNTATVGVDERIRWKLRAGRALLTVDDQYAYVLTQDQAVVAVGLGSGEVARTLPAAGLTLFAPSPERMAIFLAGTDGRLICIRPRGTAPVTEKDVLAALNPPAAAEEAPTTAPVATRPSTGEELDPLRTSRTGVPLGGRSRISREYGKGGSK